MKGFDKNKESSYDEYWYINDLYGWLFQNLFFSGFK